MLSTKRKSTDLDLQRRVRARTDVEDEEAGFSSSNEESGLEDGQSDYSEDVEGSEVSSLTS